MYTLQQQAFTLSFLSNKAAYQNGTADQLEAAATTAINAALANPVATAQLGTSWKIVWGPIVYQHDFSNVADNTMVVFEGTSGGNPVYVVGIAGTNPISKFDIRTEDGWVGPRTTPFEGSAWIANGTNEAVGILEAMTDSGTTVQAFLASKAASNATLIFAGHSLGGALSPTLALDLVAHQSFDLAKWANVYVYPTAGPTPGNQAFSDLFASTFPQQQAAGADPWNVWNMNIINTLDIVPRAWSQLRTLPSLYPPLGTVAGVVADVVLLTTADNLNTNVYAILPTSSFTGQYQPFEYGNPVPLPIKQYLNEALYQHIKVYINKIIPELASLFPAIV